MPEIQAFRGVRYDLGHVGNLSDVVAPPYDTISSELQNELYNKHAANVVRLILNRPEPQDEEGTIRYARAGRFFKNWHRQGVLFTESDPAFYVYHQVFQYHGQPLTRRGFMCRCRLERFGEGKVFPHEQTYPGPKRDRLALMRACRANLSQIFGLYADVESEVQTLLEEEIAGQPYVEATDHLGVVHRLWSVTEVSRIAAVAGQMGPRRLFIADGHHRYETACDYRDLLEGEQGKLPDGHPAQYVLMMCVGMSDPGMVVLPTHRLFRGLPTLSASELTEKLEPYLSTRIVGRGVEQAGIVWSEILEVGRQTRLAFYTTADRRWILAELTDEGRERFSAVAAEQSANWRNLGVSILHRLVIETLLGISQLEQPEYEHRVEDVARRLVKVDGEDGPFNLAALVMPATLEDIRLISTNGERMPHKSTYFYPKLLSGLVINPLD